MTKRPSTLITMRSDNLISEDLKKLIIAYMTAVTQDDHAKAEDLLHQIQQENLKNGSQD